MTYDVIIVGAGPAGLSAALWLGRCRRRVLVCDSGHPRNAASRHVHGYLGLDGVEPGELRRRGRTEGAAYGAEFRDVEAIDARATDFGFEVVLADGNVERGHKILLATGMRDILPEIPGLRALYGTRVFHCPYCDAWEFRDAPIGVLGRGRRGLALARLMRTWSPDIVLFTNGTSGLGPAEHAEFQHAGIRVEERPIASLNDGRGLALVELDDGAQASCHAMFVCVDHVQRSDLAERLGCAPTRHGRIPTHKLQATRVPGVYVAGDAARDVQFAIVAAAEGARAAYAIHRALLHEQRQ